MVAMTAALLFTIACGNSGNEDSQASQAPQVEDAAQDSKGALVVYSGRKESLVGPIIQQFGELTGIDVQVKYAKTGELAATLKEEGDNSPADVFFAQDPGGLGAVAEMLAPLPADIVALVPDWARSNSSEWVGISGRARVVVYNRNSVAESDLPSDLKALVEPDWKGRIGWAPGNASFQTMVTSMRSVWGEGETRQFLIQLKANEPKEYPKNTPIVAATAAGEIDVGLVNHYYLHRFIQEDGEDFAARNHFLKGDGPGSLVMVAGAGILKGADNSENGEKFLRFMLSTVAQQYFAGKTFEYPLVDGVNTHRLLPSMAELKGPEIDVSDLADLEGTQAMLRDLGIIP